MVRAVLSTIAIISLIIICWWIMDKEDREFRRKHKSGPIFKGFCECENPDIYMGECFKCKKLKK